VQSLGFSGAELRSEMPTSISSLSKVYLGPIRFPQSPISAPKLTDLYHTLFKAHGLLYHSTLGLRVTRKKTQYDKSRTGSPHVGVKRFHQKSTCLESQLALRNEL